MPESLPQKPPKSQMDRSYYASIEVGRRNVSLSNLKKIADGFQISIAELMRGVS